MSLVEISGADSVVAPMRGRAPLPPPPPPPMRREAPLPPRPLIRGGAPPPPPPPPPLPLPANKKSSLKPLHWVKKARALPGSLWDELQRRQASRDIEDEQILCAIELSVSEIENLFSVEEKPKPKPEEVPEIDLRRASDTEIRLMLLNIKLPDVMAAVMAMDESTLDVDQIENLINLFPTKEDMEFLKTYTGDKGTVAKSEQYFQELMKVPRVESKLRVFSFKIQFGTKITELINGLNAVNSACEEVRTSQKLKEIMENILCLGNILNQGTVRGSAVGFKLDSLLILSNTRAANSKMTLMHYLCKVLASKASHLLDFHKDLESLESASKIQLKLVAEEIQAITKGLETLNQELTASESDGPVSQVFRKLLKDFISTAETQVATVSSLYSSVGRNADALAHYFGENPNHYPFEKVTTTLFNFIRLFKKAHEENVKQAELEKKKAAKEAEMEKISGADAVVAPMNGRVPPPPPPPPPMRRIAPLPQRPPICGGAPRPPPPIEYCFQRPAENRASLKPLHWIKITRALQGSLWDELQRRHGESQTAMELDISELETLFSVEAKPEKVRLNDLRRANNNNTYMVNNFRAFMRSNNKEIMLTKVKMPLPDMMAAVMAMDDSVLDVDQIENLIDLCPTKEEMELLKTYTGDKANLGKFEQYLLELMKVPRFEAKLRVFSFKIQFGTQITEINKSLNVVNSACEEVRSSQKLKEIKKKIPCLGNTSNQGTARVEFKLDSSVILSKPSRLGPVVQKRKISATWVRVALATGVLASEASDLLDVYKDLESLESASKIQLNSLAAKIQAIIKGLEKLNQELTASETDGPVSQVFRNTLKDFISIAETQVATVLSLYSVVEKKADALPLYFGEDPNHCPFEQVTTTLFNFIRLFKKAHEENVKQADLENKKAAKMKQIDLRRANDTEIMLTKVKMPLPDMMAAVLAMDESVLDVDQIENLIRFCPTKEEMELLKNYTGDKATLGKCEQYFLELMKVPGVESKLRVFSFKIQFGTKITELNKGLNAVNSACEEVRTSQKLKEIMENILCLGNILNQGTAMGSAVGFKLDSLLILSDTCAANSKMTLMHYLCKVLASKASDLLDFHKDLESLESASKIQLKSLAEEMQAITKGLEKLNQELTASESDGPVSQVFRKLLKDFISMAETQVATVSSLYSSVERNADALAHYFGEDPEHYSFEKVTATLFSFIRLFKKAHEENVKQAELEKNKAPKEAEMEKTK
ncbi:unnamed protein product [Arabidopsis arenosa]|uniref:Formin-like protein n=1 Tax=Arabidopsis arenosa TaxID=38785 RepID=A0A8S2AFL5_ARAAE|nr:unnamed protein product [Arabidopsis arenosa]